MIAVNRPIKTLKDKEIADLKATIEKQQALLLQTQQAMAIAMMANSKVPPVAPAAPKK